MHVSWIVGRVGQDPKPIGTSGCRFSVATDRYNSSTQQRETTWSDCVAFAKTAEFITKHVKKGQLVAIVGEYQTREDPNDATKRYHSFFVKEIEPFLERDPNRQAAAPQQGGGNPLW